MTKVLVFLRFLIVPYATLIFLKHENELEWHVTFACFIVETCSQFYFLITIRSFYDQLKSETINCERCKSLRRPSMAIDNRGYQDVNLKNRPLPIPIPQ